MIVENVTIDVLSVTGHRPDKLGGYSPKAFQHLVNVAESCLTKLSPKKVITGMALGWDMAIAQACVNLGIPFIAAIPFKGQESRWQTKDQDKYKSLLQKAFVIEVISEGSYSPYKMELRNHWMVDHATAVLALYNGDDSGGTANCVRYVKKQKKPLLNAYRIYSKQSTSITKVDYNTST